MKQAKKLPQHTEYSSDLALPDIDIELDEFITVHHEHLESLKHENLSDLDTKHLGNGVFITEDVKIDSSQFTSSQPSAAQINSTKKSFIKNLFN